ncbi:MAG: SpvB/TcaC N-terminal domain-containing protein, partial [Byssovorax sp.]
MTTKPLIIRRSTVPPTRRGNVPRPRAQLARSLLSLLILTIIVLPGFAFGALCPPGNLDCPAPPPVLIVSDCSTPPGLTTPPEAPSVLHALPDPIVPAAAGGQLLPGTSRVSATGEYEYRIPIDVPAGRAGMQPSLALAYGSRGRNGHLGVGWRLEGLSEINRCARTFATEGYADGVHFDKSDSFCLDGHKLIAVSGSYGEEGTEYRTEEDTFARVRSHVTSGIGVTSFSVETRDGRVRTYAPPLPGPHVTTSAVAAWPIQEEHDRSGNSILYSYFGTASLEYSTSTVEYYPSRIDYNTVTVNDVAKSGPRNVQFVYEDRLDKATVYVSNAQVHTSQRLKSILLSAPNPVTSELVWRYDLTYDPGAGSGTGASRLVRVRRCGVQHDGTTGGCFNTK